ncbi:hypothetical protein FPOAC2_07247 [Fusarium poae]|uniref:hypothetical protein n=1 Tax=Fusarium poae TaxID=36050 RepID=UPI001CEA0657|nr:hypothetical protein FPOAC1_007094 [Fusarium poae]KAG8673775.1 hypothetical protein FPOAC1_007094 [Fusarium poae]
MKFSAVVLATAAATGAIADTVFDVTRFGARCKDVDIWCSYSFTIEPGTIDSERYECSALVTNVEFGELPDTDEGTCNPPSRTFGIVRNDEGFTLTVSAQISPDSVTKGSYLIPKKDFFQSKGSRNQVRSEWYIGSGNFPLERVD